MKPVSMPRGRIPTGLLIARLILAAAFATAFVGANAYIILRLYGGAEMTTICITPSLDCKLAAKCERHFRHHPDKIDPDQSYQVNLGDNAMFACPNFREMAVEEDGWQTVYVSQGALK